MLSLLNVANTGAFKHLREAEANKELKKLKREHMKLEKRAQGNYDQLKKISTNYTKVKTQLIETKEENKKLKNEIKELTEYISIILEAYNPEDKETVMLDKLKQLNQFIKGAKNV
ncbi:coiled-coil domain-containing protein [Mycoplasmopsis gallinacea]|uniref:Uncharacterized protein n=1 Tax=Mycoplasmopsis gallinacea TaxID=29556 RepID=A0A449A2E3_9BACT|nr:hypothetical protein [Mycoplasmopsis gallinacea]VEU58417.1 Uncharacterised protein [Mycoplasmopsis gallinacea]